MGKIYRGIVLHIGLKIRSYQGKGGGISQNAFFSNLDTINLKNFPNHGEIFP